MEIRIITAEEVYSSLSMKDAIEAMKIAFGAYSSGKSTVPLRSKIETEKGITLLMSASLTESKELAVKLVSIYDDNPALGYPRISALVMVLDPETGRPIALMDGESLTALRTGAAGGLAADLLSRKDSKITALFGAGIQGRAQLKAAMTVRNLEIIHVYDPNQDACEKLTQEVELWQPAPEIHIAKSPRKAVENADIVITATPSKVPVFDGQDLKPGTHVTAIGAFTPEMQEIDEFTIKKARVFVDSREASLAESGELIKSNAKIDAEIGEVVNGDKPGRQNEFEITFFKSVGIATQDVAAASAVLRHAISNGLGKTFNLKQ
jgi:ornithine cyclodeaminase